MKTEKIQTLEENLNAIFQPSEFIFRTLTSSLRLQDVTDMEFLDDFHNKKVLITYKTTSFLILALIKTIGVAKEVCMLRDSPKIIDYKNDFEFDISLSESSEISVGEKKNSKRSEALRTNILIYTSGTTGDPKLVCRSFDSLTNSVKRQLKNKEIIWGLCYDPEKFAGLQVLLQALLSGSTICGIDDYGNPVFSELIEVFNSFNCSAISATPSFWRILFGFKNLSLLNLKFITMGGEIVSQDILDKAMQVFPNARITHIYASTEAGVGFSVRDGKEGFPIEYINSLTLTAKLKIIDNELYIKSNRIGIYVNSNKKIINGDGYISTGDIVKYTADKSRVLFEGRKNKSMNIGGNKVMPEEIERVVEAGHYIKICKAYSIPHPLLGNIVALDFVKEINCPLPTVELKKNITLDCRNKLERHKIPVKINEVIAIKLSGSGKVVR